MLYIVIFHIRNTTKYSVNSFPYEEFYKWAIEMSKNNTVLVSEYNMPEMFKCVWEKETKANFDSKRSSSNKSKKRVEKLFTVQ